MAQWNERQLARYEEMVRDVMARFDAVGLAVSIFDRQGRDLYRQFFGWRDEEKRLPLDENTLFGVASISKSFTSLGMMQLQARGRLKITDPVADYVAPFTGANLPEPLRIWHLMCHAGGYFPLKRFRMDEVAAQLGLEEGQTGDFAYCDALAEEGARRIAAQMDAQTEFTGRPGQRMSYCNDGYCLLGDILRTRGGQGSYAGYVRKCIAEPLGMDRTSADFLGPGGDDNVSTLYIHRKGVRVATRDFHDNAVVLGGSGAVKSTLADMKRYVCMYLNGGRGLNGTRLLSPDDVEEMERGRMQYRPKCHYGFGLSTRYLDGLELVEHSGELTGVSSEMMWSHDAEVGIVVLCNTSDVPVRVLAAAALRMWAGGDPREDLRKEYRDRPWSPRLLDRAVGVYEAINGTRMELIRLEDGSPALLTGQNRRQRPLRPVASHLALIPEPYSDSSLRILEDEERGVWALYTGDGRIIPRLK